ncbi:anchor protein [Opitutaceae bacterium TAV5]|nr:anchor protein [Opitutaceae bacterium TAV5]
MKMLHKLLALAAVTTAAVCSHAGTYANITLDGIIDDWSGISASFTNTGGGPVNQIFLANNDTHLFILVTFHTQTDFLTVPGGFYLGIDNDSNAATGFNIYSQGVVGSEVGYAAETPFQQDSINFNTGAVSEGANMLSSPYGAATTAQEFSISRTGIIDTANSTPVFPNTSFNLVVYIDNGGELIIGPASYTFAAVPEPATWAFIGGIGALAICLIRRHRRR